MNAPRVSVCVPTFNYTRFLPDCIESVLQQTMADWELVITDDCSTDGTETIVERYAKADPRIHYIRNEQRLGMSANLRRACDLGRGEYLKVLCSDDWLAPRCLEVLSALLDRYPKAVLATPGEIYCKASGEPLGVHFLYGKPVSVIPGEEMLDRMARGNGFGGNSSYLIRASAYHRVGGYDPNVLYAVDYELAARLCRTGEYVHTDEPLFYGRMHPANSSTVNTGKCLDTVDWFEVPEKIFLPRRLLNREWRRYQRISALLTARYLVGIPIQHLRGNHEMARAWTKVLLAHGNFVLGVPWVLVEAPRRLYRRITGTHRSRLVPAEPWMGPPTRQANVMAESQV